MDFNKFLVSLTALITAIAGLISALALLLTQVRKLGRKPKQRAEDTQGATAAAPPPRRGRVIRSMLFSIAVLCLVTSVVMFLFLILRTQPFQVEVTSPGNGPLTVKAAYNEETRKATGDGAFVVEGTYSGDLQRNGMRIYVLERLAGRSDANWYLQQDEPSIIVRQDKWFINGKWSEPAFVGRGDPQQPLTIGEEWEIQAVIASATEAKTAKTGSPENLKGFKAKSQIVRVSIETILP